MILFIQKNSINCIKLAVFLCLAIFTTLVFANERYDRITQRTFSAEEGFAQPSVYDIEEDQDGFIWLATQRGIVKFDGYSFTTYGQDDDTSQGLMGNMVVDMAVDHNSAEVWVGTTNGLSVFNTHSHGFTAYELIDQDGQEDKIIRSLHIDESGTLWVGTERGLYKKNVHSMFEFQSAIDSTVAINDITHMANGTLVLASQTGIRLYDPIAQRVEHTLLVNTPFLSVMIGQKNAIWAGSNGSGLFHINVPPSGEEPIVQILGKKDGLPSDIINSIEFSGDKAVWVATARGIAIFPDSHFNTFINYHHSVKDSTTAELEFQTPDVVSLHISVNGAIFYGSNTDGFSILDLNAVLFSNHVINDAPKSYSVSAGRDNSVWLANDVGVYNIDKHKNTKGPFFNRSVNDTQQHFTGTSLHHSNTTNMLWAGSRIGLSKFSDASQSFTTVGFENKRVYTINEDHLGHLWLGTTKDGLFKYNQVTNEIMHKWAIPHVTKILPTLDGNVWAATINGLYLIDYATNEIQSFFSSADDSTSLPFNFVTWISEIDTNKYAVGTQSKGIALMSFNEATQKPIFEPVLTDSAVSTLSIGAIVKDINNDFWITTTEGVAKTDATFTTLSYFDQETGFDFNGFFIGSQTTTSSGYIFLGGLLGLTYFHPDDIKISVRSPSIQFTQIRTLKKNDTKMSKIHYSSLYKPGNERPLLTLQPNNIGVKIDFAALEFNAPQSIKYRYKLSGFHRSWQVPERDARVASFTNLLPGKYTFEVMSTNRYGYWNTNTKTLDIVVLAPWWQTTWAIISFVFGFIVLLVLLYKWRTLRLKQRAVALRGMVNSKTKDLELANEKMSLLLNLDPLTNIYNRRGFIFYADLEHRKYKHESKTFSIILFDIDFFKKINDRYGHNVGDQSLIFVANLLKHNLREFDIIARWGGEEFVVLLPSTKLAQAYEIADKLRQVLYESDVKVLGHKINLTISGGISEITNHTSLETCINSADKLLYEAKAQGRNKVIA